MGIRLRLMLLSMILSVENREDLGMRDQGGRAVTALEKILAGVREMHSMMVTVLIGYSRE